MEVKKTVFVKDGRGWKQTHETRDPATVYGDFSKLLKSKFIYHCGWITKLSRRNNYDGTDTVTAYLNNGVKVVFIVD